MALPLMTYTELYFSSIKRKQRHISKGRSWAGMWHDSNFEAKYTEDLDWGIDDKNDTLIDYERQVLLRLEVNDVFIGNYKIDYKEIYSTDDIIYTEVKGPMTQQWLMLWRLTCAIWPNIPGVEPHAKLQLVR